MRQKTLLALAGILESLTGLAAAATYNCLPVAIIENADHFRVECAEPSGFEGGYPRDGTDRIQFFAVPKTDADFAKRFVYVLQTALTTGLVVQFQYTSGDVSGSAFGCASSECRKPWAFGLLAPATDVRIPYAASPSGTTESIAQGKWRHYGPFSISQFRKLVVNMTGTGNADLYVGKGEPPTEINFTCRPQLSTSNETCSIPGPAPQERGATYYVGVKGVGSNNTYKLNVSIQNKSWLKYPGCAKDIGAGANGAVWVIGCSETAGGYVLRRWDDVSKSWKAVPGGGVRIAVGPAGQPWLVNKAGNIYRGKADLNPNTDEQHKYDLGKWDRLPGCGKDIAVGANGGVWLVGCSETAGGYVLRRWDDASKSWKAVPGGGVRIAVGPDTEPWIVNKDGNIYSWKADGSGWDRQPGCARDVAVGAKGAANGALWVVGCDQVSGGWSLHQWADTFPPKLPLPDPWHPWQRAAGGGTNISVAPDERSWIVNDGGNIYELDP